MHKSARMLSRAFAHRDPPLVADPGVSSLMAHFLVARLQETAHFHVLSQVTAVGNIRASVGLDSARYMNLSSTVHVFPSFELT